MKLKSNFVNNDTKQLVDQFLDGESFDIRLSTTILNTIDRVDNSQYEEVVNKVKNILSISKKDSYRNIYFVEVVEELSKKEKAVLIRFINLVYKERKFFIILNRELIHFPTEYQKYDISELHSYLESQLRDMRAEDSFAAVNKMVYKFFSPFRSKPKTIVKESLREVQELSQPQVC